MHQQWSIGTRSSFLTVDKITDAITTFQCIFYVEIDGVIVLDASNKILLKHLKDHATIEKKMRQPG